MLSRLLRRIAVALTVPALVFAVAAAADQPPLKIGIIFTFSGGGPPIGKALDAAIAAYQATHGDTVAGRKIVFVRRDDGGVAPELAKREATELIVDEKVDALYGFMLSPNAIAVGSISTEAKKPVFITNAATSGILAPNPYMARFSFTEAQVAAPLGQWAAQHGIKTAYGVFLDYGSGHEAMDAFAKAFTANAGPCSARLRLPMSNMNYAAYIQRVKDAHPNAIFAFVGPQAGGAPFMKSYEDGACAAAGIRLLATNDLVLDENLPVFGDGIVGAITSSNYSSSLEHTGEQGVHQSVRGGLRLGAVAGFLGGRRLRRARRRVPRRAGTARQLRSGQDDGSDQRHEDCKPARPDHDRSRHARHRTEHLHSTDREAREWLRQRAVRHGPDGEAAGRGQ